MRLTDLLDPRVDGRPLALARMLLAFALAVCALESSAVLSGIAAGKLQYPVLAIIPGPTPLAVQVFQVVGLLAAVCLLLGLFARASAATGSALLAGALLWDQQTYSSHHLLVTLLLAYLAFAHAGQRWGIAAPRGREHAAVPWWPQLLMMTQVSVLYLFAGLSKVNPRFLSGEPLQEWMWLDAPLWVFQALAVATVATELFLAAALWIRRARVLAVVAGVGLHLSILVGLTDQTLVLTAFAAASLSTYWLFLTRPSLRSAGAASARQPASRSAAATLD
ncbi:HTTM domain-containing protein [Agrococcus sp. DT81.2]|uniref:HTTM domain-containing protein n=1 Tax=Agrococcus sp. DT81.2 TaxID=3393414 RepID=UPI003CE4A371